MDSGTGAEEARLADEASGKAPWKKWGTYLSERQWGTVREDYSDDGDPWTWLTYEQAASTAYRWGEDGIGGFCDDRQRICLGLALWNGKDPFLKERLFGLTNHEGNHGEDVKECYYYLDAVPTHSWCRMLYKYPQEPFPYEKLREENKKAGLGRREYELLDTGIFDGDRYCDVFIEYAKAGPEDILMLVRVVNRGPAPASLHILHQAWFRNTWSWKPGRKKPAMMKVAAHETILDLGTGPDVHLYCEEGAGILFCENETNPAVRPGGVSGGGPYKDGFNDYFVHDRSGAVSRDRGTKACAWKKLLLQPGETAVSRVRLTQGELPDPFADFDAVVALRMAEADAFHAQRLRDVTGEDRRSVARQALAGMLWTKQFYRLDISQWLSGDPLQPPPPAGHRTRRNTGWSHLDNADIISMPDKWEYPWYAAWDLAFHCVALAGVDPHFAKSQLVLLMREWYMHPNGQLPAYEWNFDDVNPPVHAWAAWRVYEIDREQSGGKGDRDFLERVFHKLLINFTWWVNRRDAAGRNIFQGGFLGLDNIGVFERSAPLPSGQFLSQADATSWMAMYCLNMMRIALELSLQEPVFEDIATKFFEHFLSITAAMTNMGGTGHGLWDEEDEFYYDAVLMPDNRMSPIKVRSMVGLIPLFAVEVLDGDQLQSYPEFSKRLEWLLSHRPLLAAQVSHWEVEGHGKRRLLSLLRGHRMKRLLSRMLDEEEFLSPGGVRSMSRRYADHPYVHTCGGFRREVGYEPGDSESTMFGGNSNWRGPVWMPMNFLIIESLRKFHRYYGDDFLVECPTRSGRLLTISGIADELSRRLVALFERNAQTGDRPIFGTMEKQQRDPHFRDYLLFPECFHGDTGCGIGASHQTGWTGLIALLLNDRDRRTSAAAEP